MRDVDREAPPEPPRENVLNNLLRDSVKALPLRMLLGLLVLGAIYFAFAPKETRPNPAALRRATAPPAVRARRIALGAYEKDGFSFDLDIEVEGGAPEREALASAVRTALAAAPVVEGEGASAVLAMKAALRPAVAAALPEEIRLNEIFFNRFEAKLAAVSAETAPVR